MVKNPPAKAGDVSLIPGSGRSPGEEGRQPIPVFLPRKANGQRRWQATVHGITESDRTERQRKSLKQKFRVMKKYWGVLGTVRSLKLPINRERAGERGGWRNAGRWQGRQRPDPAGCALY